MTLIIRRAILRANAVFLLLAAAGGFVSDVRGAFFASGPVSAVLREAPNAAIGFIEAHGLAFIIGVLLWRAAPQRAWHLTAVAVHVLLGGSNLVFWQLFVATDMLMLGYVTTALHGLFAAAQLGAALTAGGHPAATTSALDFRRAHEVRP
ncbi:MAG TPA: hypothetical protein VJ890_20240 [Vineibacter sp.]|nr:hypothetical protein [Vineibacter sp.]